MTARVMIDKKVTDATTRTTGVRERRRVKTNERASTPERLVLALASEGFDLRREEESVEFVDARASDSAGTGRAKRDVARVDGSATTEAMEAPRVRFARVREDERPARARATERKVEASRAASAETSARTSEYEANAAMFAAALGRRRLDTRDDALGEEPYRKLLVVRATIDDRGGVDEGRSAIARPAGGVMNGARALFVNVARKREETLAKLFVRMGGTVADDEDDHAITHVVASDDNALLAKAMESLPSDVFKVSLDWITACFKLSERLSESDYAPRARVAALADVAHGGDESKSPSTSSLALGNVEQKTQTEALALKRAQGGTIWTSDLVDHEKLEKRREFFVCQPNEHTEKTLLLECNTKVADMLAELGDIYESAMRDEYRAKQYNLASNALRSLNFEVTSTEQCDAIPMLSNKNSKIRKYVGEILNLGKLKALEEMKQRPEVKSSLELNGVYGIGPVTAHKLFQKGFKSIADLRRAPAGTLTEPQRIGLKYYEEFKERIPREEVSSLATYVREAANTFSNDQVHCYCVGSFRRGKSSSGDIDVLVECRDESLMSSLLMHILKDLRPGGSSPRSGILTDDLLVGDVTYMGVACLPHPVEGSNVKPMHRRMDIKVYHSAQLPTALLYFTGSARFNRSMRLWAKLKGFNLQDKGLYADRDQAEMSRINVTSEEDVFVALGLDYVPPERRNV